MSKFQNDIGVQVPELLLPGAAVDMQKWSVVACDQYTSQPDYWAETEAIVGGAPSTLRLTLPEYYLGKPDEPERIAAINAAMREYLQSGVLENRGQGLMFVKRTVGGKTRCGMLVALDLDHYDYSKGSATLIRASEGTIVERIPPRLRIRQGAPLETPHILVLIDDPARTVIEPLGQAAKLLPPAYDFELMQGGGHISGCFVQDEEAVNAALAALAELIEPARYRAKYHTDQAPLLFAMGDGNHSFATAKANWEQIKKAQGLIADAEHPARYALVELENIHDAGIVFEPIHRVMFHVPGGEAWLRDKLAQLNGSCTAHRFSSVEECLHAAKNARGHVLPFCDEKSAGCFHVETPAAQLPVGTLQNALDEMLAAFPGSAIDYIHGDSVVRELGVQPGNMGFLLPPMDKNDFFRTVIFDGALPRKTFSMGEANEKRFYLECRSLEG